MSANTATTLRLPGTARGHAYARHYWAFAVPAAIIVLLVILFPWLFTLFMSVHDWKVTGATPFVGLANYAKMLQDERFQWAIVRTLDSPPHRSSHRYCLAFGPPSASRRSSSCADSREPCSYCR